MTYHPAFLATLAGLALSAAVSSPASGQQVPPFLAADADWERLVRLNGGEVLYDRGRTWRAEGGPIQAAILFHAPGGSAAVTEMAIDCSAPAFAIRAEEQFDEEGRSVAREAYGDDPPMSDVPSGSPILAWIDALCDSPLPSAPPGRLDRRGGRAPLRHDP